MTLQYQKRVARQVVVGCLCVCVALAQAATPAVVPATLTAQSGQQVSAKQLREAGLFWTKFRQALLTGQTQKLESMTRLPLVIKGVTDDQAPRRVSKSKLWPALKALLAQEVYPAVPADAQAQSLRKVIEDTPELQPRHWTSPKQVRVESLAFAKGASGWQLVTAYEEAP